jgi:hypothetical protein
MNLIRVRGHFQRTSCGESTSSSARGNSEATVSFLTKIRKVIHTTPVLRQVSQGFANAWGAGKAYDEYDKKIGYSQSGEPVPSQDQYQGFGRSDLAQLAAERYPGTTALVSTYRDQYGQARALRERYAVPEYRPAAAAGAYDDEWMGDENAGEFYDDGGDDYADEE